jgi:hypothetical protein
MAAWCELPRSVQGPPGASGTATSCSSALITFSVSVVPARAQATAIALTAT